MCARESCTSVLQVVYAERVPTYLRLTALQAQQDKNAQELLFVHLPSTRSISYDLCTTW